ncbi:hypothetical protein BH09DEP1_BH09DEP1_6020 [soil metagenome]
MNRYSQFFLLNLIIFSMITSFFTKCESNNPETVMISLSKENEKIIYNNKSVKERLMEVPWKVVALRYAFIYGQALLFYHGVIAFEEWRKDIQFSSTQKELVWHEMVLAVLIAEFCWRDISCSPKDKDPKNEQAIQATGAN